MPAKNTRKIFVPNGYYHAYNRGVEKRIIFLDDQDHQMFLHFLKYYLAPPQPDDIKQIHRSLFGMVQLLAFCLMPNHYHLLLQQYTIDGMTKLIRDVSTSYVGYFNKKYERVGGLFQGKYKAALIDEDAYLLHVSRYIHINPQELNRVGSWIGSDPLQKYPYSSYSYYLGYKHGMWINPLPILGYFQTAQSSFLNKHLSYQSFVEGFTGDTFELLQNIALDS